MSNYGFATYDDKKTTRKTGEINSKWPIFGPKYSDIKKCFKTIHITDTYEPSYKTADLPLPEKFSENEYRWSERQLIYQFEHKMGFRPVGYAFASGNIKVRIKGTITQNEVKTGDVSSYGGNFTLNGVASADIPILPNIGGYHASVISTGYSPLEISLTNKAFGIASRQMLDYGYIIRDDIIVPDACISAIQRNFYVYGPNNENPMPYEIEIDDKYVKIYRNVQWLDWRYYYYSSYTGSYTHDFDYTLDIRDRVKCASYYAGSEVDFTIYLCPYKMEDLI